MKKTGLTAIVWAVFVLLSGMHVPAAEAGRPQVHFSEWTQTKTGDSINTYERVISVSDGGNYLMSCREHTVQQTDYSYNYAAVYQGMGIQKAYTRSISNLEFEPGKLFPFETTDECGLDIDQIISDHIRLQLSEAINCILIFRPHGGEYDGTVQTVRVTNGAVDLTSESFRETESVEVLGVFRFPEAETKDLLIGPNVKQKDGGRFVIWQAFYSEAADGIGLITYNNSSGNEVCVTQVLYDGLTILKTYDRAETEKQIQTGCFAVKAFSHDYTDADFIN